MRVQDGKTLTTDGPFVEIKEAIGGYLLFEADNLDAVGGPIASVKLLGIEPPDRPGGLWPGGADIKRRGASSINDTKSVRSGSS